MEGYWSCIGAMQNQNSSSYTPCLHSHKPEMCEDDAWYKLQNMEESEALEQCVLLGNMKQNCKRNRLKFYVSLTNN